MKRRILSCTVAALLLMTLIAGIAPASQAMPINSGNVTFDPVNGFMMDQKALFEDPDIYYRPGSRWWLPEGLGTDDVLKENVKILHDMGISTIEIVCMPEEAVDNGYQVERTTGSTWPVGTTSKTVYSWGSEEWNHDQEVVIEECTKYGMGFSMTSGTHWANANLPDWYLMPDDDGAGKSLSYTVQRVEAGQAFDKVLPRTSITSATATNGVKRQDLVRVVAIKVDPSSAATINTSNQLSGTITYGAEKGIDITSQVQIQGDGYVDPNAPLDALNSMKDSTGAKNFWLHWTAPNDGTYFIFSFWMQATGQSPTPSATRNFTISYIDKSGMDAFINYYKDIVFANSHLVDLIKANGRGEMYMDSLEISNTNGFNFWGYTFMDTFKQNRGYDLTEYLPYIIHSGSGRSAAFSTKRAGSDGTYECKIYHDLFETMNDCYRDNVLKPLKAYLNTELNMKLRAEITYGVNYEITTPTQYVDYTETESLEYKTCLDSFRVQAGAAHIWGIRLSSETGAMSGQNYVYGQDKYMQIINTQFASGITYTVFHGYSNEEGADPAYTANANFWTPTYWPGHEGMYARFSERWGPRQPAFVHYNDYMAMIARAQAVLQQGIPQMDIGILTTDYNNNNSGASRASANAAYGLPAGTYDPTRDNRGLYWQDMSLQNNGYTYDYFAPENLNLLKETGITMYGNNELLPSRVGYQALIMYQQALSIESAKILLELAQAGLPIIFVDNVFEDTVNSNSVIPAHKITVNTTGKVKAASRTLTLLESDTALQAIVDQIKALPNVRYLPNGEGYNQNNPYDSDVYQALLELGVRPRAELVDGAKNIYTQMRKTDDALYVFAYNAVSDYDYNGVVMPAANAPQVFSLSVDTAGKPYLIDPWTGNITEVADYAIANSRTDFNVNLEPGETAYFALDLNDVGTGLHVVSTDADKVTMANGVISAYATESGTYTTTLSDGTTVVRTIDAPGNIALTNWTLVIDSYTNGTKTIFTEDRGLGYLTKNAYYETKHTNVGPVSLTTPLRPWKDIAGIGGGVSGVGTYTTTFTLPNDWDAAIQGAYLDIESFNGNTAQVFINGEKAKGFDFIARIQDISTLLKPGVNEIKITVSSSLLNVVRYLSQQAGTNYSSLYSTYATKQAFTDLYATSTASASNPWQSYGMVGNVSLVTYGIAPITYPQHIVLADIRANEANVVVNNPASYTVALEHAKGVGVFELSFIFDGYMLDKDSITATPLNGFALGIYPGLSFQYLGQGIWKGTVKYMYLADKYVNTSNPMDVLRISGTAIGLGSATITLTDFAVLGDNGTGIGPMLSVIRTPEATVTIGSKPAVYSKYDLNKDGSIDETDLLYVVYFYQWNDRDASWDTVDLYGIFAKDCDFQVNGKVDLADMIELTANYGIYDPYA